MNSKGEREHRREGVRHTERNKENCRGRVRVVGTRDRERERVGVGERLGDLFRGFPTNKPQKHLFTHENKTSTGKRTTERIV